MKFETWMAETTIVAIVLAIVAYFTGIHLGGQRIIDWIGAAAVLYTFKHASVSDRLAEKQGIKIVPDVSCYRKLREFYVIKEILWVIYFIILGSYTPLIGCAIFLFYPIWRKIWRRYYPMESPTTS